MSDTTTAPYVVAPVGDDIDVAMPTDSVSLFVPIMSVCVLLASVVGRLQ